MMGLSLHSIHLKNYSICQFKKVSQHPISNCSIPIKKKSVCRISKEKILLFYSSLDFFTGVCTTELCSVRDNLNVYTSLNAEVVGISVDSIFTLGKFKEEQQYNFQLLSDFNKTVSQAYGAFYDEFVFGMKGVSRRAAFVVDKNGMVQYAEVLESAGDLPNFDAIKAALSGLN